MPAAVSLPALELADVGHRLERAVNAVAVLMQDLTFREREIRRAEAELIEARERMVDLERERL